MGERKTMCSRGHDITNPKSRDKFGRCLSCRKATRQAWKNQRLEEETEYRVQSKGRSGTRKTGRWTTKATYNKNKSNQRRKERLNSVYRETYDRNKVVYGASHCWICKKKYKKGESRSLDHVIPISRGGPDAEWNVRSAHTRCNSKKGNKILPTQMTINLTGD